MTDELTATHPNAADAPTDPPHPDRWRWVKRGAIALVAAAALVYGAIFFYANVLNDAPDALDEADLTEALAATPDAPATDAPATDALATDAEAQAAPDSAPDAAAAPASFDGIWVPTTASEFGYRVDEVLGGVNVTAVGRSNEIEGALTVDGATANVDVTVQVANITSDDSRRDGQFTGRIMDAANFPEATFRTTEPIDFGEVPTDGSAITATALGELTLKGVTQAVTVEVTAQADSDSIGVLGNIPITFTDYGIDNPSNPGVSLEDQGIVEFVLVFEQT